MNEHEELLAKAWACLSDASKIEDPVVRAKVLDLFYHSQQVAQTALLQGLDGGMPRSEATNGTSFADLTLGLDPKLGV